MTIDQLKSVVEKCGSKWEEKIEDDITIYVIDNWFEIEKVACFWLLSEIATDYGDRDTPPSGDLKEIGAFNSLDEAVAEALILIAKNKINYIFDSIWADEFEKNNEEIYS